MDVLYKSSYKESLNALEADIQHANVLAAAIPRAKGGTCLHVKLVRSQLAPYFLFLLQWMNCSFTCLLPMYLNFFHIVIYKVYVDGKPKISFRGRKATIKEFYAVILPWLRQLCDNTTEIENKQEKGQGMEILGKKRMEKGKRLTCMDLEKEDECEICMEPCSMMVLPNCCHTMCINCYRDWNTRSESCPFCRGSLKRVKSEDLWVLTCSGDVVDMETAYKEDLLRFYLFINNLPKDIPDDLFLMFYEYLI